MKKSIATIWYFTSKTNPDKVYETLQYVDGTTSCNCPGWCRRTDENGNRSCKHTRSVTMGTADSECDRMHTYAKQAVPELVPGPIESDQTDPVKGVVPKLIVRWK